MIWHGGGEIELEADEPGLRSCPRCRVNHVHLLQRQWLNKCLFCDVLWVAGIYLDDQLSDDEFREAMLCLGMTPGMSTLSLPVPSPEAIRARRYQRVKMRRRLRQKLRLAGSPLPESRRIESPSFEVVDHSSFVPVVPIWTRGNAKLGSARYRYQVRRAFRPAVAGSSTLGPVSEPQVIRTREELEAAFGPLSTNSPLAAANRYLERGKRLVVTRQQL